MAWFVLLLEVLEKAWSLILDFKGAYKPLKRRLFGKSARGIKVFF